MMRTIYKKDYVITLMKTKFQVIGSLVFSFFADEIRNAGGEEIRA